MSKTLGLELIAYGVLLAGFSLHTNHFVSAVVSPLPFVGLDGGTLSLLWAGLALLSNICGFATAELKLNHETTARRK